MLVTQVEAYFRPESRDGMGSVSPSYTGAIKDGFYMGDIIFPNTVLGKT